jgi:hypothetical protein
MERPNSDDWIESLALCILIIVYSTYTIFLPGLLGRQRPSVSKNSSKCKIFGLIMAGGVRAFVGRLQKKAVGDFLNKLKKDDM